MVYLASSSTPQSVIEGRQARNSSRSGGGTMEGKLLPDLFLLACAQLIVLHSLDPPTN